MAAETLDETDRRLLALLRQDARAPTSSLAAALGLARSTVKARIDRLRARGVIRGFSLVLGGDAEAGAVRAITLVESKAIEKTLERLGGFPEIAALHTTNGRWDIVLEIETDTLQALDTLLSAIRGLPGVAAAETHLLLSTRRQAQASGKAGSR